MSTRKFKTSGLLPKSQWHIVKNIVSISIRSLAIPSFNSILQMIRRIKPKVIKTTSMTFIINTKEDLRITGNQRPSQTRMRSLKSQFKASRMKVSRSKEDQTLLLKAPLVKMTVVIVKAIQKEIAAVIHLTMTLPKIN